METLPFPGDPSKSARTTGSASDIFSSSFNHSSFSLVVRSRPSPSVLVIQALPLLSSGEEIYPNLSTSEKWSPPTSTHGEPVMTDPEPYNIPSESLTISARAVEFLYSLPQKGGAAPMV